MMIKQLRLTVTCVTLFFIFASIGQAEEFYKGKTIRFVVGFSAGGGFDTYKIGRAHV